MRRRDEFVSRAYKGPVDIQVITYAPTVFFHCQHCELTFQQMGIGDRVHREHAREALPEDLRDDFQSLSEWIHHLIERHGRKVKVRVIDAASIEGFWKSLRHRARKYPTVIVGGRTLSTRDFNEVEEIVEKQLMQRAGQ